MNKKIWIDQWGVRRLTHESKPPTKQKSRITWLASWWVLLNMQRRINTSPFQTLPKNKQEGITPKSFYNAGITLIPKPYTWTLPENKITIQCLNINASILNKILANQIQQYSKRLRHLDQVGVILGTAKMVHISKSFHVKYHIIISIDPEKHWQENPQRSGYRGNMSQDEKTDHS